jgi:putative membrane protein
MNFKHLTFLALAAALAVPAAAAAAPPARFLHDAIQGDNSEITLGAVAQARGASPGVRQFGARLQSDHANARREAVMLARSLGVPAPNDIAPEARRELRLLQRLHGPAFDREFARYMVEDHRTDIDKFRVQAAGRGPTADLARRTIPTLQTHLQMARALR